MKKITLLALFAFIYISTFSQKLYFNKTDSVKNLKIAFFSVDCIEWNDSEKAWTSKGRIKPLLGQIVSLFGVAEATNIPVMFTTCCSGRMPLKNSLDKTDVLYVPIDSTDNKWKNKVSEFRSFYIEKKAFGCPKLNNANKAWNMFKDNRNIPNLIDLLGINTCIVFGDGFDLCCTSAINGLLSKGVQVIIVEDVISSSASGNEEGKIKILNEYKQKGVKVIKYADLLNWLIK